MYNSFEERALIQHVSRREGPGVVVGVGSEIPERTEPWRFRKKFGVKRPFAIYIGRIDENKGCPELFSHFERYSVMYPRGLDLVLIGANLLPIPKHPRIRHLGYLSDEDKFDALVGRRRARSCRRRSRACRWWRSRRGRSENRCWPTATATCSAVRS